jgi:hypothetical protein
MFQSKIRFNNLTLVFKEFLTKVVDSLQYFDLIYSQHSKSGPSGFRMVIFRTLFESCFQMLWPPFCIRKPDKLSGFRKLWTRLDRFI